METRYKIPTDAELMRSLRNLQITAANQKKESVVVHLICTPSTWAVRLNNDMLGVSATASIDTEAPKEEVALIAEQLKSQIFEALEEEEVA